MFGRNIADPYRWLESDSNATRECALLLHTKHSRRFSASHVMQPFALRLRVTCSALGCVVLLHPQWQRESTLSLFC